MTAPVPGLAALPLIDHAQRAVHLAGHRGAGTISFVTWPLLLVSLGAADHGPLDGALGVVVVVLAVLVLIVDRVRERFAAIERGMDGRPRRPRAGRPLRSLFWLPVAAIIVTNMLLRPVGWWIGLPIGVLAMIGVRIARARWDASFEPRPTPPGVALAAPPVAQLAGIPTDAPPEAAAFPAPEGLQAAAALAIVDRARVQALEVALELPPGRLEPAVAELEAHGLVKRAHVADGEPPIVFLTKPGRRAYADYVRVLERAERR